jgi:probable HAF family extracellular repeat protein
MYRSLLSALLSLSVLLSTLVAAQGASYTFTPIDAPGAPATYVQGINETGQIVGWFQDATGSHGFVTTPVKMDTIPPVITVAASPATLWPPNGQRVAVRVSGMIIDAPGGSGVKVGSAAYVVMDEYGQIQPSGNLTLGADGSYAFTVELEASRRGNDRDGRHYTIAVSARDNLGNPGFKSTLVTVPHG